MAEAQEVVEELQPLGGCQLVRMRRGDGVGPAMAARQAAGARRLPVHASRRAWKDEAPVGHAAFADGRVAPVASTERTWTLPSAASMARQEQTAAVDIFNARARSTGSIAPPPVSTAKISLSKSSQ